MSSTEDSRHCGRSAARPYHRPPHAQRATKRGAERTPLDRDCDVLICGASFAGLAVARELAGSGADVLVIDRYEIGERQTSACGIPTGWLEALDLQESLQQTFPELVHPHAAHDRALRPAVDVLDLRLPDAVRAARRPGHVRVRDRQGASGRDGQHGPHRSRRIRAPLIVDALGWRRVLGAASQSSRPTRCCRAGSRSTPSARGARPRDLDRPLLRPGRLRLELPRRRGGARSASARSIRASTSRSRPSGWPRTSTPTRSATRATGSPTRSARPPRTAIFFVGDSAGHCLPLTAEGIRTALYFGIACGRELRAVIEGRSDAAPQALARYARVQRRPRAGSSSGCCGCSGSSRASRRGCWRRRCTAMGAKRFVDWSFGHYLNIAHPSFRPRADSPGARPPTPPRLPPGVGRYARWTGVYDPPPLHPTRRDSPCRNASARVPAARDARSPPCRAVARPRWWPPHRRGASTPHASGRTVTVVEHAITDTEVPARQEART